MPDIYLLNSYATTRKQNPMHVTATFFFHLFTSLVNKLVKLI